MLEFGESELSLTHSITLLKKDTIMRLLQVLYVSAALLGSAAYALPSVYVSDTRLKDAGNIKTRSTLIADNEDPSKVWVLPPTTGEISFKDFAPTSNTPMCGSLKELIKEMEQIDSQIKKQRQRIKEREPQLAKAHQQLIKRRTELAELGDKPSIKEIILLESRRDDVEERIEVLIDKLDQTEDPEVIKTLKVELKELRAERSQLRKDLKQLRKKHREDYAVYAKAQKRYEAARQNFAEVDGDIKEMISIWQSFQEDILNTYKNRGRVHSGTAAIDYETGWQQELDTLKTNYADLDFVPMATFNSRIYAGFFAAADEESYYQNLPPLVSYSVNGQPQLPWGKRLPITSGDRGASGLAATVVGDFHYNLIGGCPIVDKEFFADVDFAIERKADGTPKYGISASYEYDMAFRFDVEASYNLYRIYEKVVKHGSRGGLFTSRSYADVMETQFDEDAFSIRIFSDESLPPKTITKIRAEIKKELINRVLTMSASPTMSSKPVLTMPGVPPKRGAIVMADGLNEMCGFHLYCQAGSWLLRIGDSIWGNSSAEATFKRQWNRTAKEVWSQRTMTPRQSTITFRR